MTTGSSWWAGRGKPHQSPLSCSRLSRASTSWPRSKTWMAGTQASEATPSFGRLCPAMTIAALPNTTLVHDRAGITLHPLAQRFDQLVVDHEIPVVVGDLVRGQRLEALRRRDIGARRE